MAPKLKKTKTKKRTTTRKVISQNLSVPNYTESYEQVDSSIKSLGKSKFFIIGFLVLVAAGLLALAFQNRSLFIAGTINGTPVTRMELNKRLTDRYGSQVFESIIGERLIAAEAEKQSVSVTGEELNAKISEIEASLNGQMKLEEALKLQGVTQSEFENQVRIQLLIDKMLSKEVSVSATEVDDYVKNNSLSLTATEAGAQRQEAEKTILSNKIAEKFQEWFAKLKEAAKVQRYL